MKKRNKTLRNKTLKRDKFTCQKCGLLDKKGDLLEIHHKIPLYNNGVDDLRNTITLCRNCHRFAPENEKDFSEYMKEEMTGTATILMKAIKKVREEHLELFDGSQEKL